MKSYSTVEVIGELNVSPIVIPAPPLPGHVAAITAASFSVADRDFSSLSDIYVTAKVAWSAADHASWLANGNSPSCFRIRSSSGAIMNVNLFVVDDVLEWRINSFSVTDNYSAPPATPDEWHLIELHQSTSHADVWIDGVSVLSEDHGSSPDAITLRIESAGSPDIGTFYFDDVKIGTTRGGSDIFSDDFETDLSNWDVSDEDNIVIVDDPYP